MPQFKDPLGHEFKITREQARGYASITCPVCRWLGSPADGGAEVLSDAEEPPPEPSPEPFGSKAESDTAS